MGTTSESVQFEGALGNSLDGELELPEEKTRTFAIFAHCFTGSKDLFPSIHISRRLAERGIGVLRFDFTGLGQSGGDFSGTTFSSTVGDVVAAEQYLTEHRREATLLVGHSFGGTAAIAAARQLPQVEAVATIGAPYDPAHVEHLFSEKVDEIKQGGEATVTIQGRSFQIRKAFLEDIREREMAPHLEGLDRPMLLFHAATDEVVGLSNAEKIYEAAKHPKSLMSLGDTDHLLTNREDIEYIASILEEWAERNLSIPNVRPPDPRPIASVTTRKCSTPRTRPRSSQALSASSPIGTVPQG
ncbi:MAG: alpha/beta hydrolase family protein [Bradymonadaceae bacterium]